MPENKTKVIALSGGLDPVHIGHLEMFKAAKKYGKVVVILNSDEWLKRKKGYVFMPFKERKAIVEAFRYVDLVVKVDDSDDSVCEAIERIRPDFFGNGGDRKIDNVPEVDLCNKLGVEMIWNLGGEKTQSSSLLVNRASKYEADNS